MSSFIGIKGKGFIEDNIQNIIKLDSYELY